MWVLAGLATFEPTMNLVTAIVVDTAMKHSAQERNVRLAREHEKKAELVDMIRNIFHRLEFPFWDGWTE